MEIITIQVDHEVAKAYREAAPNQQQKIQSLVNDLLKKIIQQKTLDDIIKQMQTEAKNNGLNQEILDDILRDG
jgi:peptidyl-tRNA hydrolase